MNELCHHQTLEQTNITTNIHYHKHTLPQTYVITNEHYPKQMLLQTNTNANTLPQTSVTALMTKITVFLSAHITPLLFLTMHNGKKPAKLPPRIT